MGSSANKLALCFLGWVVVPPEVVFNHPYKEKHVPVIYSFKNVTLGLGMLKG